MPRKKAPRKRSDRSANRSTAPLVGLTETGLRSILNAYKQWRATQPIEERLAELLWSPEGMNLELPSPTIMRWEATRKRSIKQKVDAGVWFQRKLARQRTHGDGALSERAKKQKEAFELCKRTVYAPLRRMDAKAGKSLGGWLVKQRDQKAKCDACWQELQVAICEIGERFRDAHWLDLHSREARRSIREEYQPRVQEHAELPLQSVKSHYRFVREHLGAVVDADAQAYIESLNRVITLWPKIKPRLDFTALLPTDANYRGQAGRPHPPARQCEQALRSLKPKLSPDARCEFLVAWSLR